MPRVTSGARHPLPWLSDRSICLGDCVHWSNWGWGEGVFHIQNVLKVPYFKCYLMQVVYSHTQLFKLELKQEVVISDGFICHSFPPLLSRWTGTCHRLIIWVICCRWGGEVDTAITSDLQTLTHNSNCTLVTDAIIAHWPLQTSGALSALAASGDLPGGLAPGEDGRLCRGCH